MSRRVHQIVVFLAILSIVVIFLALLYFGSEYYMLPLSEKFYHVNHKILKSSGLIGHGLGIIGSILLTIGVVVYIIRKRVKRFYKLGKLKYWLEFHIYLATLGPVLILFHTAFRFGGIVSVSFWSMVAVLASGIIGRYLYQLIPHSIEGNELSKADISKLDFDLRITLQDKYKVDAEIINKLESDSDSTKKVKISGIISFIIKDSLKNRKQLDYIKQSLHNKNISAKEIKEILSLSKAKLVLARKIILLKTTQRLFGYWHVAHFPFAVIMFVIMIVHIVVAFTFGYKWIF
ncbi:MAG: hypothetical protein KKF62_08595 [Bacteroidetes bacterium]|nr:hypothetical protein [Bacteroidota bacterium]MBU1114325.1 hypothetical protein [Bacteroidota bacterium]MBU1797103.1 hypothetical protein [Bacteroidota bacterium]